MSPYYDTSFQLLTEKKNQKKLKLQIEERRLPIFLQDYKKI